MTPMTAPAPPGSRGARRWWITSAVLLLVASGLLVTSLRDEPTAADPPARAAEAVSPTPATGPAPPTESSLPAENGLPPDPLPAAGPGAVPRVGEAVAGTPGVLPLTRRSAPAELRIPAIEVAVAVSELGLNPDETVEVPTDFQRPGWYRLGTAPGQLGSAVILGHVDSRSGPAAFFRLRELQVGEAVEVTLADGTVARFAVTEVATYPKDRFPAERVYGSHGDSALVLVTCGGEFDRAARSYRSNVVVYSTLVETV